METIKKTTIHRLTAEFVEIDSEQYIEVDGQEVRLDMPKHAVSYANSASGREQLKREQPKNIIDGVFAIWGKTPTVAEHEPPM